MAAAAHALQIHAHTSTCAKSGHAADDDNCRMGYPRPLCSSTRVELTACITQRRNHRMLVPYSPSLLLAQPCNHALYAFTEIGRFQRDLKLFRAKQQQPGGTQAVQPALLTLEQAACDSAEYSSKYATKADGAGTNIPFLRTAVSITQAPNAAAAAPSPDAAAPASPLHTPGQQGRYFLRRVLNRTHAATTYPAALTTLYLLGHGDSTTTFDTAFHSYHAHQQRLLHMSTQQPPEQQQEQQQEHTQPSLQADGSLRIVQAMDDYMCRDGSEIQAYSPYLMTALFQKVRKPRCAMHGGPSI